MIYEIKRGAQTVWKGKAEGKQNRVIMQADMVEITIKSAVAIAFRKGDTIQVYGQTYKLNLPDNITQVNTQVGYTYTIEFEALYYDLGKWILYTLDGQNNFTQPIVHLTSQARTILGLLVQNANRASSGWSLGIIDDTDEIQWSYNGAKLLTVLQDIADQTNLEFWVDRKTINLTRRQNDTGLSLAYGKGKGLYELSRTRREDPIVTHLTIAGGSRNIPNGYGYRNIQPAGGNPLVNPTYTAGQDRVESVVVFENIYPRLNAKVTATSAINVIRSTDLDFDLNEHLLDDRSTAQIAFTSGRLNGFTFNIAENGYTHANRQILFNKIEDDNAYPLGVPNEHLKAEIGDSFVLLNINMPQSYVDQAEARVRELGEQYFAEEGIEQYEWAGRLTPKFALENNVELTLGGLVNLQAPDIGFSGKIRVDSYTRDLQQEYLYEFTLSNVITINKLVRERNTTDRLASTVSQGLSPDGLSSKSSYAERAGFAVSAGHANTATNAVTAERANHATNADNAKRADHADKADLATRALKADHADTAAYAWDSDKWDGAQFADYLDQPVRKNDSPMFAGVSSQRFVSGFAGEGYRISRDANGDTIAEFDRLTVRKDFSVYELIVNQIRATNGSLWVSDSIKVASVTKSGTNYLCKIDTDQGTIAVPFVVNDILRCQRFNGRNMKYYVARVTATNHPDGTFTLVVIQGASIPSGGDEVVRMGNTTDRNRQGAIYATASDNGAPYIDVIDGVTSASLADKVKARLGKLDGIVDPAFGPLSGYGLYAENVYLRGRMQIEVSGSNVYTKTQTDGNVSAAKSEAISSAASDATTKANNARTQAINSAATDAQTRANAAREAAINTANQFAQEAVNALEIGARNILAASKSFGIASTESFVISAWAHQYWPSDVSGALLNPGEKYTISFAAELLQRTSAPTAFQHMVGFGLFDGSSNLLFTTPILRELGQTLTLSQSFVAPGWVKNCRIIAYTNRYTTNGGNPVGFDTVRFTNLKLEKGTKATDWSPAPEDVTNALEVFRTETSTQFNVIQGEINSKVSQSNFNALGQRVGAAESTISQQAGLIAQRVTQTQFDALSNSVGSLSGRISSAESSITQQANQISIKANQTLVDSLGNRISSAEAKITPDQINLTVRSQTQSLAKEQVDALRIGTRNLLSASKANGTVIQSTESFTISSWASQFWAAANSGALLTPGETYALTFTAELVQRTTAPTAFAHQVGFALFDGSSFILIVTPLLRTLNQVITITQAFVAPTWVKNCGIIAYTNRYTTNGNSPVGLDTVKFTNVKLEKGNKASDWTPSPEDVDAEIAKRPTEAQVKAGISIVQDGISFFGQRFDFDGKITAKSLATGTLIANQIKTSELPNRTSLNEDGDGLFKVRHANGVVGIELGLIGGEPVMFYYDNQGRKLYELGQGGIVYQNSVPESWTTIGMILVQSISSESVALDQATARQGMFGNVQNSTPSRPYPITGPGVNRFLYSEGINGDASNNRQFSGYHTTQVKSLTNWVPNGWYVIGGSPLRADSDGGGTTYSVAAVRVWNGKRSGSVTMINGVSAN